MPTQGPQEGWWGHPGSGGPRRAGAVTALSCGVFPRAKVKGKEPPSALGSGRSGSVFGEEPAYRGLGRGEESGTRRVFVSMAPFPVSWVNRTVLLYFHGSIGFKDFL